MAWQRTRIRPTFSALFATLVLAAGAACQESPNPLLSAEIRAALEAGGPEGARARFAELFPDRIDGLQVDLKGLYELAAERISAGDMESGGALMEMVAAVNQAVMETAMPGVPAAAAARDEEREARGQTEEIGAPSSNGPGPARKDLRRFRGQYGRPGQANPRNLFVMETCDGYLVAGALWADVGNWNLTSVSEESFKYSDSFIAFTMTFEVGEDGVPVSMSHTLEGVPSPLPYMGPLPAEWGDECLTVQRGR